MSKSRELQIEEARAIMSRLADAMCDELTAIANNEDEATKMDRAAELIGKAAPEVTALVMLGLLGSLREYEDRFTVYESLLAKVAGGRDKGTRRVGRKLRSPCGHGGGSNRSRPTSLTRRTTP